MTNSQRLRSLQTAVNKEAQENILPFWMEKPSTWSMAVFWVT